jgi:asparagine synthase (glutamine-hydrolysing)
MCGIFGAVNIEGPFLIVLHSSVFRINDVTSYRGPDDHGVCRLKLKQRRDKQGFLTPEKMAKAGSGPTNP